MNQDRPRLDLVIRGGLSVLLFVAPLPFGSVSPRASALLTIGCLALGGMFVISRAAAGAPALPWASPLLAAGLMIAGVGAAQLVPLPVSLLARLSPDAAALRAAFEPGTGGWRPISLEPEATAAAVVRSLAYLLVALMSGAVASERRGRRWLLGALVASGTFQGLYGLFEYVSDGQRIFGFTKRVNTDVATGTFINPNHYAGYLAMLLPIGVAAIVELLGRSRERLDRRLFVASAGAVGILAMAAAVVCSRSRMGIAALLAACLLTGAFALVRAGGRGYGAAVLIAALALAVMIPQGRGRQVIARFLNTPDWLEQETGRLSLWGQSARLVERFRWTGSGLGTFPQVMPAYQTAPGGRLLRHAHNDYVEWVAETGAAGGLLLIGGGAWLAISTRRRRGPADPYDLAIGAGLGAAVVHAFVDFNMAIPSNALTAAALLGILARPGPEAIGKGRGGSRLSAGMVLGALVLGIGWTAAMLAGAGASGRAERAGRLHDAALADLGTLVRGGTTTSSQALRFVRDRIGRAVELQEDALSWRPLWALGQADLGRMRASLCSADVVLSGRPADCVIEGVDGFRRALALRPAGPEVHARAARFALAAWSRLDPATRAEAREWVARAALYNPRDAELVEAQRRLQASEQAILTATAGKRPGSS